MPITPKRPRTPDSSYAWWRLAASLALSTIGGVGLWSAVVVLPTIQAEFAVGRGGASLPFTATMVGFAIGGVLMGRVADRLGIMFPLILGAPILGLGFLAAAFATSYWQFVLVQALLIGMLGSAATFGPLVADVSLLVREVAWHRGVHRGGAATTSPAQSGRRYWSAPSRPSAGAHHT